MLSQRESRPPAPVRIPEPLTAPQPARSPRARTRPAAASPTSPGLRRLPGLADAVAAAAGIPRAQLRGNAGWARACARIAESRSGLHGPPCPLVVVPVREGRKVAGMALAPGACLSGLAAAVPAGRRVPVLVRGACPAPVAKALGLRLVRRRPWPGGPEAAARLETLAGTVISGFSTWCVRAGEGDPWHSALVMPRVTVTGTRQVTALVVVCPDPLSGRVVPLDPGTPTGPSRAPGLEAGLRAAISAALACPAAAPACLGHVPSPYTAASLLTGAGAVLPDAFDYRVRWVLSLSQRSALAAFRRTLPPELSALSGLTRSGFDTPSACAGTVEARSGWTGQDHLRVLQAMRAVPWLLAHARPEVVEAARAGKPLEAVVRAATGGADPLHPKVVRSLRGSWRMRKSAGIRSALDLTCASLDALYRADPHRPALPPGELRNAVDVLARLGHLVDLPAAGAAAILALRQPDGAIGTAPEHLRDFVYWLAMTVGRILEADPGHRLPGEAVNGLVAVEIAFPPHRRRASLAAAVEGWHARAPALANAYGARLAACQAERKADAAVESARIRSRMAGGPAHVLDGPACHGDVVIRPLLDAAALREEGDALGHCVGSYEWAIESGHCILMGLESPAGRSTVEARPEDGGLRIAQHHGVRNGPPPPGHAEALAGLVADIPRERLSGLAEAMAERARVERRLRELDIAALDDGQRAGLADLLMGQLRPFLGGPHRRLGRGPWTAWAAGRARALLAV